jgi:predicted kinase
MSIMQKPTLYIMCGLAFSGKTTLAKSIAKYFHAENIRFDSIYVEKEKELNLKAMEGGDAWRTVRAVAMDRIREHLSNNEHVVYDDTNPKFEHREEIRVVARECEADAVVIYLNTPNGVLAQRQTNTQLAGDHHDVASHYLKETKKQLEIPSYSKERVMVFSHDENVQDFLRKLTHA